MIEPTHAEIVTTATFLRARIDGVLEELDTMEPRLQSVLGINLIAAELRQLRDVADAMASPSA
jgi:hypothetical protein